ncbi:hypothetical protein PUNSTDRAFT_51512 [Punctularia strigosozonata HHB-11173 SS5]|uniref:uncharacterized protein n=1 Tax=Punctularia strigosozonata (strain HHB-11173) TaxID=741275 RepID=UPI000441691F|nr:uncharacterized protein PUNSTDRAFT_51512 [Punctularia strigosozonata HHB-11173 SS5]EIN10945.1 hypothetical protein PUNSTDRAFT_51512 [Punctularia strigosozonata HHB-11173 SS5]
MAETGPAETLLGDIPSTSAPTSSAPLSKNAQKKAAKAQRLAEIKVKKRQLEKEKRKEKKRIREEKRAAGELDESELKEEEERARKKARLFGPKQPFGARVVVDLGFDDKMTEKEIVSLISQLGYTYSANRRATRPFSRLLFTSLNGRTKEKMDATSNAGYSRWKGTEWWEESYEGLWAGSKTINGDVSPEIAESPPTKSDHGTAAHTVHVPSSEEGKESSIKPQEKSRCPKENIVYLTADADEEISELREGETYIIGGICDHNRYKNLCLNKAVASGIRSARLPIGTYLAALPTRKVLTVNQAFEILVNWVDSRDWEHALNAVMPQRKFNAEGKRRRRYGKDEKLEVIGADELEDGGEPAQGADSVGVLQQNKETQHEGV